MVIERDERPWGHYEVVDAGDGFQVKRICVVPGGRLSYQRHRHRSEHWFVISGEGLVTVDDVDRPVGAGGTVDIPLGSAHRVRNVGGTELVFIEVQTGAHISEDDTERLHDDYGRDVGSAPS